MVDEPWDEAPILKAATERSQSGTLAYISFASPIDLKRPAAVSRLFRNF